MKKLEEHRQKCWKDGDGETILRSVSKKMRKQMWPGGRKCQPLQINYPKEGPCFLEKLTKCKFAAPNTILLSLLEESAQGPQQFWSLKSTWEYAEISALQRNIPRSRNWSAQADNTKMMKSSDRLRLQECNKVVQVMDKWQMKLMAKVVQHGFVDHPSPAPCQVRVRGRVWLS